MQTNTSAKPVARYSHSGICVSDIQKSMDFYQHVFGFTRGGELRLQNQHQALLGFDGDMDLHSVFLRSGGLVIELLHFATPEVFGPATARAFNQRGLTHFSFNVDSIEESIRAVETWGGSVLAETRSQFDLPHMSGEIVFVTDPDGTRIELMGFPQDVVNA